ncbi:MAG: YfiR family protein [Betaproteobacteria bacterium]
MRRALLLVALLLPLGVLGRALEHEVKAAYLFRFLSFVEWPQASFARPDSPIVIGVMGAEDVLEELRGIVPGRVVQGRPVAAVRWREGGSLAGIHLLYVGREASGALPRLPAMRGVLVVSDTERGLDQGSVVNFVRSEGRLRFEVAVDAAERRELRISSRMLAVASSVRPGKL